MRIRFSGFIKKIPEISFASFTSLLPGISGQFFTSSIPTLTVTNDELDLSLNIINGPRFITAFNDVYQSSDIGYIQDEEGTNNFMNYKSPKTFTFNSGTMQKLQTPSILLDGPNGKNKYRYWLKTKDQSQQNDIAPGRIQITVGSNDETYKAKFDPAKHIQLSNILEGSLNGGTVTYGNTTVPVFDDYDYYDNLSQHNVNSNVPNGTLGRNWIFLNWSDGNSNLSRTIVVDNDKILQAKYKGLQTSSNALAFPNSSQRKVLSTYSTPENLFQVYESVGNIWMEKSTDGGTSWSLYPSNAPLFNSCSAPFLDHMTISGSSQDYIFVTCVSGSNIKGCMLSSIYPTYRADYTIASEYNYPGNPVVAYLNNNRVMVVWKGTDENGQSGLVYNIGTYPSLNPFNITWYFETEKLISGTGAYSINPTMECLKNDNKIRLAWEENSTIKYRDLLVTNDNSIATSNTIPISNYSGFSTNTKPSIIAVNGGSRLTWVGKRTFSYPPYSEQKAVFMDPSNSSQSWSFSNNVQSSVINLSPQYYSIAWSRSNTDSIQFADSYTLRNIKSLPIKGIDVQLSNGNSANLMRAVSFNNASAPYFFSNANLYSLNKIASGGNTNSSREGVVINGDAQFYFAVGDVYADGKNIEFITLADTTRFYSLEDINSYLVTKPIPVNNQSALYYSVQYGISDSMAALNSLRGNNFINFKVEILDAVTNELLGTSDNIRFDSSHVSQYNNIAYQLNTEGIGNRTIKLKMTISSNANIEYSLKNSYATEEVLLKKQNKQMVVINLLSSVNNYYLAQNYPNPFNPATTIKYQMPKDGIVTLKVYDILGREVASLINEYQKQ